MKRIVFFLCATMLCLCSCVNSETHAEKVKCQELCESLETRASLQKWSVVECKDTVCCVYDNLCYIVGKVPVYTKNARKVKGVVLTIENGQRILTTEYLHVPVNVSSIMQKAKYVPKKHKNNGEVQYRPLLKKQSYYIMFNGEEYPLKAFTVLK